MKPQTKALIAVCAVLLVILVLVAAPAKPLTQVAPAPAGDINGPARLDAQCDTVGDADARFTCQLEAFYDRLDQLCQKWHPDDPGALAACFADDNQKRQEARVRHVLEGPVQ